MSSDAGGTLPAGPADARMARTAVAGGRSSRSCASSQPTWFHAAASDVVRCHCRWNTRSGSRLPAVTHVAALSSLTLCRATGRGGCVSVPGNGTVGAVAVVVVVGAVLVLRRLRPVGSVGRLGFVVREPRVGRIGRGGRVRWVDPVDRVRWVDPVDRLDWHHPRSRSSRWYVRSGTEGRRLSRCRRTHRRRRRTLTS
jgi:hypothetical protein